MSLETDPKIIKHCGCGQSYNAFEFFNELETPPAGGRMDLGGPTYLELRNCYACDSTLGVACEWSIQHDYDCGRMECAECSEIRAAHELARAGYRYDQITGVRPPKCSVCRQDAPLHELARFDWACARCAADGKRPQLTLAA